MADKARYPARSGLRLFWKMGGWVPLILGAVLVVLSLIGQSNLNTAARFEAEGRWATGVIADKYTRERRDSDGDRKITYYLVVEFVTGRGEDVSVRRSVGSGFYRAQSVGDELEIRYLASEPSVVELTEGSYARGAVVLRWVALVFGILSLVALWVVGRWTVEALRARKFGAVETALVVKVAKTSVKVNRRPRYRLVWQDSAGREGRSLLHKSVDLHGFQRGQNVRIYQGLKRSWWARDIGDRPE